MHACLPDFRSPSRPACLKPLIDLVRSHNQITFSRRGPVRNRRSGSAACGPDPDLMRPWIGIGWQDLWGAMVRSGKTHQRGKISAGDKESAGSRERAAGGKRLASAARLQAAPGLCGPCRMGVGAVGPAGAHAQVMQTPREPRPGEKGAGPDHSIIGLARRHGIPTVSDGDES